MGCMVDDTGYKSGDIQIFNYCISMIIIERPRIL